MKSKKNILIVTSEFPPLPGGIGNHAFNLAAYLSKNNYKVTVITDQRGQSELENSFDAIQPFSIFRISLRKDRRLMYLDRVKKTFTLYKSSNIIIASGKFSLWQVAFTSFFYRRKTIAVIHGTEVNLKSKIIMKLTSFCIKKMNEVVSVSNYTKSLMSSLDLKKSLVIPNGYTIETNNIVQESFDTYPNLITVGRVSERKGQINVIKALPEIVKKHPNVCYRMVGIPEDKDKLEELAENLKVIDHIVFYGKQEYSELYKLVNSSDVFMMLSQNDSNGDVEGFGIAILEANSFGIPAIGSKGCGIEDAINHSESGLLVNPKSEVEISNAIDKILNSKKDYQKRAFTWSQNFTWDEVILKYIDLIE